MNIMMWLPPVTILPPHFEVGPTTNVDTDAVVHELASRDYISKAPTMLVFICCGEAQCEVDIWRKLCLLGYNIEEVLFMDQCVTSVTISNIQSAYANDLHNQCCTKRNTLRLSTKADTPLSGSFPGET